MRLERLSERVWVFPYEERRDRPNLCYIKGDNWSIAVDAGHSADHVMEFYKAIEEEGFPLPKLTVLTHWHWDHTFGMHAVSSLTLANVKTNRHLEECIRKLEIEGPEAFLNLEHISIPRVHMGSILLFAVITLSVFFCDGYDQMKPFDDVYRRYVH